MSEDAGALAGLRVLNLADERGAYCAKLLADLGADVLKVEPPGGDRQRRFGPFLDDRPDPERSLWFWYYHTNQRSVVLDLETAEGRARLKALAAEADVLIEGFAPGQLEAWGLGYAALSAANPSLIVTSVTTFGQTGPHAHYRGGDLIGWALSGVMSLCGEPGRPPLRGAGGQGNHLASLWAAIGTLAAVYQRRLSGQGQQVDASLQEAVAAGNETVLLALYGGEEPKRSGSDHAIVVPYSVFPAADGWALIAAVSRQQWRDLAAWLVADGQDPALLDPELEPVPARLPLREMLNAAVADWVARYPVGELVTRAQAQSIPIGPVNTPGRVANDVQLAARGFFVPVDQPAAGRTLAYPGAPYRMAAGGWRIRRPAPRIGENSAEGWQPRAAPPPLGAPTGGGEPGGPLAGLKIADFTWVLAGPFATRILADLGATVVKVEPREVGDSMRGLPPFLGGVPDINRSGQFVNWNRNKRGISLDLKHPRGRELARRLALWADVLIDNFSAGTMARFGLDWESLRAVRPDLIAIAMAGLGQTGPHRDYVSYHAIITAMAGLTYLTAYPDGRPNGFGASFSDFVGGLNAAVAALAAVEQRARTGQGQFIDLAQLESVAALLGPTLLDYLAHGREQGPWGNRCVERGLGPHGVYPCAGDDRWIALAAMEEDEWQALCALAKQPAWRTDPRFATGRDRYQHQEALDALIGVWTAQHEPWALMARCQAAGIPAGVVATSGERRTRRDPHLAARGFDLTLDQPEMGTITTDRGALVFSRTPVRVERPAPLVGQDTTEVLAEFLGYSPDEIDELLVEGAI